MKLELQDLALRALILIAGTISAVLLTLKGHVEALPGLAIGGTLGAFFMTRFGQTGE